MRGKTTFCHTCRKEFHYLGINRHRAMHRDKNEDCKITYTSGDTYCFMFSRTKADRITTSAKAGLGSIIVICQRDDNGKITSFAAEQVDGKKIKADTWYELRDGKIQEVRV